MEAYCVKCGKKQEMKNPKEESFVLKGTKRWKAVGTCPKCDTNMTRFLPSAGRS